MSNPVYKFQSAHGPVYIQAVETPDSSGKIPAHNKDGDKFTEVQATLESALTNVEHFYQSIAEVAQKLGPSEIGVEIGVKFNVKTGIFIISAGTEVDFKLSLKWNKKQ